MLPFCDGLLDVQDIAAMIAQTFGTIGMVMQKAHQ